MPGTVKNSEHGFEFFEEQCEQENLQPSEPIDEAALADLDYVDVTEKRYRYFKRFFDVVCAFILLIVLFVPFILIALLIFIDDPGPVFFRQYRVGLKGKRFRLYKFRSMKVHAPKYKSTNDLVDSYAYITRIGKILRKLSIDELPQLINVLAGHMSLVGPRPLISDERDAHILRMRYGVYNVRPGITGLAQINGRDTVSVTDKVRYDVNYIKNFSLLTDIKILFLTLPRAFGGQGVVEGKSHKLEM